MSERIIGNEIGLVSFDDVSYLVDAVKEGKDLEVRLTGAEAWVDVNVSDDNLSFNFKGLKYRVKQNWYDNIPEHGVLCWVDNRGKDLIGAYYKIAVITKCVGDKPGLRYDDKSGWSWNWATPLTDDEIKQFLRGE